MAGPLSLHYVLEAPQPQAHLLDVELSVTSDDGPLPAPFVMFLPTWAPGSYLVREYARHIESVEALDDEGRPLAVRKVRKNRWVIEAVSGRRVRVRYRVYAGEVSVRTNHVDASHLFWNGPATYLVPEACRARGLRATVEPRLPDGWTAGTSLAPGPRGGFVANDLDTLMDAPFECGAMPPRSFEVHGRRHDVYVWNNRHAAAVDWERLLLDSRRLVETEATLLAGSDRPAASALPYERYAFLWQVSPRSRGGLEHADSCALLVSPTMFQTRGGYLDVLSLVAHEFLHLWNVKRIRPAGLVPLDYERENLTRLLWWFEGGTSYFDWRILRLAWLATPREYADHLAGELARLADTPGARIHSLSEASFDAWIKAYRPDENALNSTVSYYLKGEVVCALLDLEIRSRSEGLRSLDDVLRHLWWDYGQPGRPVAEDALGDIIAHATGVRVDDLLERWVEQPGELDPGPTLALAGLRHERRPISRHAHGSLGARARSRQSRLVIDQVVRGGAAMRGGLEPGDEVISVAGRRADDGLEAALQHHPPGTTVEITIGRDGWTEICTVTLDPPTLNEGRLVLRSDASSAQLALLEGWLGTGAAASLRGA